MAEPKVFPTFNFGERCTFTPYGGTIDHGEAADYIQSVVYRDGWSFHGNENQVCALNNLAFDPVDRRVHVWISRVREVKFPTTINHINDLILELICEIEDHERLEWLRQYQTGNPAPQPLFAAHCPEEPYNGPESFSEGKRVYTAHARRRKRSL